MIYFFNKQTKNKDAYRLENFLPFVRYLFDDLIINLGEVIIYQSDENRGEQNCSIYFPETENSPEAMVYVVQTARGLPEEGEKRKRKYLDRLEEAKIVDTRIEVRETGSGKRKGKLEDLLKKELGI